MSAHEFHIKITGDGGAAAGTPPGEVRQPPEPVRPAEVSHPEPVSPPKSPGDGATASQPGPSPLIGLAARIASAFNMRTLGTALSRYDRIQRSVHVIGKELEKQQALRAKAVQANAKSPADALRDLMAGRLKSSFLENVRENVGQLIHDISKTRAGRFAGRAVQRVRSMVPNVRGAAAVPVRQAGGRPVPTPAPQRPGFLARAGQYAAANPAKVAMAAGAVAATAVAVGAATLAVRRFVRSLNDAEERFKLLAPRTAAASARAEVAQVRGDLARADQLDPGLAQFLDVQSDISQILQDIKTDFQDALLKIVVPAARAIHAILELLEPMLELIAKGIEKAADLLVGLLQWLSSELLGLLLELVGLERDNAEARKERDRGSELIDDFLNMDGPADGPPGPLPGGAFPPGAMGMGMPGGLPAGAK